MKRIVVQQDISFNSEIRAGMLGEIDLSVSTTMSTVISRARAETNERQLPVHRNRGGEPSRFGRLRSSFTHRADVSLFSAQRVRERTGQGSTPGDVTHCSAPRFASHVAL